MSSTKSLISLRSTNAGTHNSWTSLRSWRCSLYFQMIRAWQVGDIEFQCCLTRFLISKMVGIEVTLWRIRMGFWRQYDEFVGKIGMLPGQEGCLIWCARSARGVLMVMEKCRMELRGTNPGQGALAGIEVRQSSGAAHPGSRVPNWEEGRESGMNYSCF